MALTYEWIGGVAVTASTQTITVSSISGSYTDLRVILVGKLQTGSFENCYMYINGVSSAGSYSWTQYQSSASGFGNTSSSVVSVFWDCLASSFLTGIIDIPAYTSSTYYRGGTGQMYRGLTEAANRGTICGWKMINSGSNAVTSVSFYPAGSDKFAAGSYVNVYGILRA